MAYVPPLGKTFMYGGFEHSGLLQIDETWEYQTNALATFTAVGSGCTTSAGVPNLTALTLPWVGTNFTMEVSNTPATAATFCVIGTMPVTLPLSTIGIGPASCVVLVNPVPPAFLVNMPVSLSTGRPTLTLPVPPSPALVGGTLLNQAVVVDLGAGRTFVSSRGDAVFGAL